MTDLAITAGVPVPVQVNGKTYEVSPLTLEDWAIIEAHAEERLFAEMRKRLDANKDDAEMAKALRMRMATIGKAEVMRDSAPYMDDAVGTRKRFWLMLRHRHPNVTEEQAGHLIGFAEFNAVTRRLLGIPDEPEGDANAKPRPTGD